MAVTLLEQITIALAQFSSVTRLYELTLDDGDDADLGAGGLLVEAFVADVSVQGLGPRDVIVLSTKASVQLAPLLGRQAALAVSLPRGSRTQFQARSRRPPCWAAKAA